MDAEGTQTSERTIGLPTLLQCFGVVAAVLPLLISGIRLISVSRYDTAKMLTMLQYVDVFRLVIATIMPNLVVIVLVATIAGMTWIFQQGRARRNSETMFVSSSVLASIGLTATLLVPLFMLLTVIGITLFNIFFHRFLKRISERAGGVHRTANLWLTAALPVATSLIIPAVFADKVWLSAEVISVKNQPKVVAYVLGDNGDFTAILREDDRSVALVRTEDIEMRVPCNVSGDSSDRPLAASLGNSNDEATPRCPKLGKPKK